MDADVKSWVSNSFTADDAKVFYAFCAKESVRSFADVLALKKEDLSADAGFLMGTRNRILKLINEKRESDQKGKSAPAEPVPIPIPPPDQDDIIAPHYPLPYPHPHPRPIFPPHPIPRPTERCSACNTLALSHVTPGSEWQCGTCTVINNPRLKPIPKPVPKVFPKWECPACTTVGTAARCTVCNTARPANPNPIAPKPKPDEPIPFIPGEGKWKCVCTIENVDSPKCYMCGTARPPPGAEVADSKSNKPIASASGGGDGGGGSSKNPKYSDQKFIASLRQVVGSSYISEQIAVAPAALDAIDSLVRKELHLDVSAVAVQCSVSHQFASNLY